MKPIYEQAAIARIAHAMGLPTSTPDDEIVRHVISSLSRRDALVDLRNLITRALGGVTVTDPQLVRTIELLVDAAETTSTVRSVLRMPDTMPAERVSAHAHGLVKQLGELLTILAPGDGDWSDVLTGLRAVMPSGLAHAVGEVQSLRDWRCRWEDALVKAGLPSASNRTMLLAVLALEAANRARSSSDGTVSDADKAFSAGARYELDALHDVMIGTQPDPNMSDLQVRDAIIAAWHRAVRR